MSPRSPFAHWSAVSLTGSSSGHVIALDQSGARKSPKRAQFTTEGITGNSFTGDIAIDSVKITEGSCPGKVVTYTMLIKYFALVHLIHTVITNSNSTPLGKRKCSPSGKRFKSP